MLLMIFHSQGVGKRKAPLVYSRPTVVVSFFKKKNVSDFMFLRASFENTELMFARMVVRFCVLSICENRTESPQKIRTSKSLRVKANTQLNKVQ